MTSTATWIETLTGRHVDILDPDPSEMNIEDIAHALSNTNRFGGHLRKPYSVAQHCVLMSYLCPPELAFECLMHDAHEAYIGDMPSPFKIAMPEFQRLEDNMEATVRRAFNMPGDKHPRAVKHWDQVMLMTEARDFGLSWYGTEKHTDMPPAHADKIVAWDWLEARTEFLFRYHELTS